MSVDALKLWFGDHASRLTPITIGNLNQTFVVENDKGRFVLQRLNPIFSPEVNLDIEALTSHLNKRGVATTRLIPTLTGSLWGELDAKCWRLLSFVEGENFSVLSSGQHAREAGGLVGKFHHALADFHHEYHFVRADAHDTKAHLRKLELAIQTHGTHEMIGEVRCLADQILRSSESLNDLSSLPKRHAHGDLKINNIIFAKSPQGHSLIDLDTIGLMPWPIEMGDAFRSWCNPSGENAELVCFNEAYFEAALSAYADVAADLWSRVEVQQLIEGVRTIPLELASRFLRDVLEDNYFGYDATRFSSRSAHNWLRAKGQFGVYCDIENKKAQLEHIIKKSFA
jgi:Ser/Thr protein kinase RdoA (MazF antagonist)